MAQRPRKGRSPGGPKEVDELLDSLDERLERLEMLGSRLHERASSLERQVMRNGAEQPPPLSLAKPAPAGRSARARGVDRAAGAPGEVQCPGCSIPTAEPLLRCPYCGFLFSVLPPSRRPGALDL